MDTRTIENLEIDLLMERNRQTGHLPTTQRPLEGIPRAELSPERKKKIEEQLQLAIQH